MVKNRYEFATKVPIYKDETGGRFGVTLRE
jgi:hypothetical protein